MSDRQRELIDYIDSKLSLLLNNMEYDQYLDFIKSNKIISKYDDILGYVDIDFIDKRFLEELDEDFLLMVKDLVEEKLKEVML